MKHKQRLTLLIGTIALLAVSMMGFTSAQDDIETLSIAFIGSNEGQSGEFDQLRYQAAILATEDINTNDDEGIISADEMTYQLEVIYYPANTQDEVIEAYEDALADDVIAILGPHDDDLARANTDAGTPDVPVLLGAPDSLDAANVYPLVQGYDTWGTTAANYLVNERKFTNIAVIAVDTTTASFGTDAFVEAIDEDLLVANIVIEADETDLSSEARSIRESNATALFVWVLDSQMVNLQDALDAIGWDGTIFYTGLQRDTATNLTLEASESIYGLANWSPVAYDSASQVFVADYEAMWDEAPLPSSAVYYDAVWLLADAVSDEGDSVTGIINQLNTNDMNGLLGNYRNGQSDSLLVLQMLNGTLVEAGRYDDTACITCLDIWLVDSSDVDAIDTQVITLGLITTLDGPMEAKGEAIEQAVRLAIREVNDANGVIGTNNVRYTFALRTYSAMTSDDIDFIIHQAVEDGVDILLGPDSNAQILQNLFDAENADLVQLVSASSSLITDTGSSEAVLQLLPNDDALAIASATYLLDVIEAEHVATVAVRTDYGLDTAETFVDAIEQDEEARVVTRLEHDVDESDFTQLASDIQSANVSVVAVWSTQPATQSLLTALDEIGWQGMMVYGYLTPDMTMNVVVPEDMDLVGAVNWWHGAEDWASQDFVVRFTDRYRDQPTPESVAYYDAVHLIASVLDDGNADSLESNILGVENFIGVQGEYTPAVFANGELSRAVQLVQVQDEGMIELARFKDGFCLAGCE